MKQKGFTIIEILVAIAVIIAVFTAILGFFAFEVRIAERGRMRLKAVSFAEEAMEAVRNFRDNTTWEESAGISGLTTGIDYHSESSAIGWNIVLGNETINKFTRTIVFNEVYRDVNHNISGSGAKDENTRKVTVAISWSDRQGSTEENLVTFITNWQE